MFDHITLRVKDGAKSRTFYQKALAPLGWKMLEEYEGGAGFGTGDTPSLWVAEGKPLTVAVHVAFESPNHDAVGAFHAAALRGGGRDNGTPGIRQNYGPHYYAAFVLDPDGNNIEAVCNKPTGK